MINITRERVRQIESKALEKIKNSPYKKDFVVYMDNPEQILKSIEKNTVNQGLNKVNACETKDETRKRKTIYKTFNKYTKEEVNKVIESLDEKDKKIIELKYGKDLDNPVISPEWNKGHTNYFYTILISKI